MAESGVPAREALEARRTMNAAIRRFLDAAGFLEVDTPIAVQSPGLEPHLLAFETEAIAPNGSREKRYLHTSPEYAMKRMLARGTGPIYQLARVFRNGERSRTHAPEFTMLEWYRSPGALSEIMDDVESLIAIIAHAVNGAWRPRSFRRISVSDAFLAAGIADPLEHEDVPSLRRAFGMSGVQTGAAEDSWDDLFFRAFFDHVEPSFSREDVTLLHGYPARMAALSRIDSKDPRRAERFEIYVGALELANAFGELTDPVEQRSRFKEDLEVRRKKGIPAYPIDEAFLEDLGHIESAAGIALGVDRLLMLCLGLDRVQDVIAFSPLDE